MEDTCSPYLIWASDRPFHQWEYCEFPLFVDYLPNMDKGGIGGKYLNMDRGSFALCSLPISEATPKICIGSEILIFALDDRM